MKDKPTAAILRQLLTYDPITGILFWRERPVSMFKSQRACNAWNKKNANKRAFYVLGDTGYQYGSVFRKKYKTHRIAWAIYFGDWPTGDIDHKNGIRNDNRIANLRCVSRAINLKNAKIRSRNTSGFNGVSWCKRHSLWNASITVNYKKSSLGYHKCITAAVIARKLAEQGHGFTERHGS